MARLVRRGTFLALVAIAAFVAAGVARADGDPASDVLYTGHLFVPFDTAVSKGAQETLLTAITEATRAGYPIRVAVIEKPADLGSVTSLWGKPREYARFLDLELAYLYKGPLLIVMPSGVGFAHYKKGTAAEYRALSSLRVQPGGDGLALTATRGVERLAARAGHPIVVPTTPPTGGTSIWRERLIAGGVAFGVALGVGVLAFGGASLARRRRARA